MFIQSVTRRFKKLFGGIMLRYRVRKFETIGVREIFCQGGGGEGR